MLTLSRIKKSGFIKVCDA